MQADSQVVAIGHVIQLAVLINSVVSLCTMCALLICAVIVALWVGHQKPQNRASLNWLWAMGHWPDKGASLVDCIAHSP